MLFSRAFDSCVNPQERRSAIVVSPRNTLIARQRIRTTVYRPSKSLLTFAVALHTARIKFSQTQSNSLIRRNSTMEFVRRQCVMYTSSLRKHEQEESLFKLDKRPARFLLLAVSVVA